MTSQTCDMSAAAADLQNSGLGEIMSLISQAMALGTDQVQIDVDQAMALTELADWALTSQGRNIAMLREASSWAALAARNIAALEKAVGAAVPDTMVFGAVPVADLSGCLNLTAGDIRALAAGFHATGKSIVPAGPSREESRFRSWRTQPARAVK